MSAWYIEDIWLTTSHIQSLTKFQFLREEDWVEDECNEDGDHWKWERMGKWRQR